MKRFSWSLLASTLLFLGFCFVAFAGIFPWIESQFYSPNVVGDYQLKLQLAQKEIVSWQKVTQQRIDYLVAQGSFKNVYAPTQSRENLQTRFQNVKLFLQGFHSTSSIRVLDSTRDRIHFSSQESDILAAGDFSISYKRLSAVLPGAAILDPAWSIQSKPVYFDVASKQFSFVIPFKDQDADGYLLVQVGIDELTSWLFEKGILPQKDSFIALANGSFVWSKSTALDPVLIDRIGFLTKQGVLPPIQKLAQANSLFSLALLTVRPNASAALPQISMIVPQSQLELSETQKWVILASFYTLLFLITFFLFNLKADAMSSVARKVKRFQLQVLKDYLDLKEQEKIKSLKDELTRHTQQIKDDIRHSLGKIRKTDQEWVNSYIDKSWNEILELLGTRGGGGHPPAAELDWNRLERLILQALEKGHFVVSGQAPKAAPQTAPVGRPAPKQESPTDAEEVEELESLEEVEELEEVEDLDPESADEVVEELEEVEEAEEVTDEVEELEEVEEAQAVEELEELEEVETVEDVKADPVQAQQASSVSENLDDVEELEALDDDTEVSEVEALPLQDSTSNLFRYAQGGDLDSPLGILESVEEPAEELEELEAEENPPLPASVKPDWISFDLDRLDEFWRPKPSSVFEENDEVVMLNSELFSQAAATPQDDLGQLLQEMESFKDDDFPTLSDEFVPSRRSREWIWTGGGFDWDRFVQSAEETEQYKALSEASKAFGAFSAAILIEENGVWRASLSVGFSDNGKLRLHYSEENSWKKDFLSARALHVLKEDDWGKNVMKQAFHERDLKYMNSAALVPIIHDRRAAWLLLGFRGYPDKVETLLAPRVIQE